ncbi:PadR family transcriptional regulator [Spongiactinospora sp. 9N601]|uniref:PadR family transcriptional regulator n=1 Tax=Spongiactinospora sp. 9N601 TaxID=3375149 RepID=UPI00379673DA
MSFPTRITNPLLMVLEVFVHAFESDTPLHGWAIKKATGLSGAATYKMLDRLEDAHWIAGQWEANPEPGKPARRLYRLTPTGLPAARAILAERRPAALRRPAPEHGTAARPLRGFFHPLPGRLGPR